MERLHLVLSFHDASWQTEYTRKYSVIIRMESVGVSILKLVMKSQEHDLEILSRALDKVCFRLLVVLFQPVDL